MTQAVLCFPQPIRTNGLCETQLKQLAGNVFISNDPLKMHGFNTTVEAIVADLARLAPVPPELHADLARESIVFQLAYRQTVFSPVDYLTRWSADYHSIYSCLADDDWIGRVRGLIVLVLIGGSYAQALHTTKGLTASNDNIPAPATMFTDVVWQTLTVLSSGLNQSPNQTEPTFQRLRIFFLELLSWFKDTICESVRRMQRQMDNLETLIA